MNLTRFVIDPFTPEARFDFDRFARVVRIFTRMLDNVVEVAGLPLEAQMEELRRKRRHGMGTLGLGSVLNLLGIRYGSDAAVELAREIHRLMAIAGWEEGVELAREKGPAPFLEETFEVTPSMLRQRPEMVDDGFKVGDRVQGKVLLARYSRYMQQLGTVRPDLVQQIEEHGCRFTHHTSIAPTGTISFTLGNNASNGIEPSFSHGYYRNIIRPGRKTKEQVMTYSFELLAYRAFVDPQASADELPSTFVSAETVTIDEHIRMQAAAQFWVDSAISKTVNVPEATSFEDFQQVYRKAYSERLKGCTTYRPNPKGQVGVLVTQENLDGTVYVFHTEDGQVIEATGSEEIEYDGAVHTAANLYSAIKEGTYGRF